MVLGRSQALHGSGIKPKGFLGTGLVEGYFKWRVVYIQVQLGHRQWEYYDIKRYSFTSTVPENKEEEVFRWLEF